MPAYRSNNYSRKPMSWTAAKAIMSGRGGAGRGGASAKPPPPLKTFKTVERSFARAEDSPGGKKWHEQQSLDAPGVDSITFGDNFAINDDTLETLMAHPALCARLQSFFAGDYETGNGSSVTDAALIRFVNMCPKLKILRLDSHTQIGIDALLEIVRVCPKLEALKITGHDRGHGRIDDKALGALAKACEEDATLATKLRDLTLTDQSVDEKAIRKLQKARHLIIVHRGDTPRQHAYQSEDQTDFAYKAGR